MDASHTPLTFASYETKEDTSMSLHTGTIQVVVGYAPSLSSASAVSGGTAAR